MKNQFGDARIFLLTFLIAGPRYVSEILEEGKRRGLSRRTIFRAADNYVNKSGSGQSAMWSAMSTDEFIERGYGANIKPVFDPTYLREVIARVDAADAEREKRGE